MQKEILMHKEILNTAEILETYVKGSQTKVTHSLRKVILLGVMAGAFVALGAEASSVAMHGVKDVGLSRLVAGVVFPIGLMMIFLIGGELFTGDCLVLMGVLDKKLNWKKLFKLLVLVFFANMIGAVAIGFLVSLSGQWDYSNGGLGAFTYKLAVTKSQISMTTAIVSGILCNILVCGAVLMVTSCGTVIGKIFAIFFSIMAFVISGFEHCVANMYYLSAGFFASFNPAYVSKAQELYGNLPELTMENMLFNNLLFVTIGNVIGGFLVALIIYYVRNKED